LIIYNPNTLPNKNDINNIYSKGKLFIYSDDFFVTQTIGVQDASLFFIDVRGISIFKVVDENKKILTIYETTISIPNYGFRHYCRFYSLPETDLKDIHYKDYYYSVSFFSPPIQFKIYPKIDCSHEYDKYDTIEYKDSNDSKDFNNFNNYNDSSYNNGSNDTKTSKVYF